MTQINNLKPTSEIKSLIFEHGESAAYQGPSNCTGLVLLKTFLYETRTNCLITINEITSLLNQK